MKLSMLVFAIAAMALLAAAEQSQARPRCDGPFSLDGSLRARYCRSEYLARVAGDYGLHVSGAELRERRSVFQSTCQLIKHDPRAEEICHQGSFGNPLLCSTFGCE